MLKSDLHSTLQLYAPTFVASLGPESLLDCGPAVDCGLNAGGGGGGGGGGGAVRASCVTEGDFAGCAGRVTEVSIEEGGRTGGCATGGGGGGKGGRAGGCATGGGGGGKGEGGGGSGGAGGVKEVCCPGAGGVGPSACNVLT